MRVHVVKQENFKKEGGNKMHYYVDRQKYNALLYTVGHKGGICFYIQY